MISAIAHSDHPICAPVSEVHLERLLTRAKLPAGARILDLGCGEAAWTLRALELYPDATADGADISAQGLAAAAKDAEARGLSDRIRLHETSAVDFPVAEPYDLVLCVGSTHAFGGLAATMDGVRRYLRPGGLVLVGEAFWERPPTPEALTDSVRPPMTTPISPAPSPPSRAPVSGWSTGIPASSPSGTSTNGPGPAAGPMGSSNTPAPRVRRPSPPPSNTVTCG